MAQVPDAGSEPNEPVVISNVSQLFVPSPLPENVPTGIQVPVNAV